MLMKIRAYPDGRVVYETIINSVKQTVVSFKDGSQKLIVEKTHG